MKKLFLALAFVALVSGCICGGEEAVEGEISLPSNDLPGPDDAGQADTGADDGVSGILGDMTAAIASGIPYECTYTYEDMQVRSVVQGEKFRSDVTMPEGVMHSLSDGVWMYSWQDGVSTGTKFKLSDFEGQQEQDGASRSPEAMADYVGHVECRPAMSGASFVPPSNVAFTDMGAMLADLQQDMVDGQNLDSPLVGGEDMDGPQDFCSVCAMIPDAQAKQECLESCGG